MALLESVILRGTRAAQPAATAVATGTVYCVTNESNILERSNGTAWQAYSPAAGGGGTTVTNYILMAAEDGEPGDIGPPGPAGASGAGGAGTIPVGLVNGRLTLTTGVPVTTADVTAASTIYFTPYNGNQIALYDGAAWQLKTFAQLSLALSGLTSGKPYDVFIDYNAGTPQIALGTAWTDDTTRAVALALQDGVYVLTGATTKRYVGTIYTTATTTTEDSAAKRYCWNLYNRAHRSLVAAKETANSWTYTTAAFRQANANAANQLDCVIGINEVLVEAVVIGGTQNSSGIAVAVGVGVNSTTVNSAQLLGQLNSASASITWTQQASYRGYPGIGRNFLAWLEYSAATGTTTWQGDANRPTEYQNGILGSYWG